MLRRPARRPLPRWAPAAAALALLSAGAGLRATSARRPVVAATAILEAPPEPPPVTATAEAPTAPPPRVIEGTWSARVKDAEIAGPAFAASSEQKVMGLRPSRPHLGAVTHASGAAPASVGASCLLLERTRWLDKYGNCDVVLTCGGARVFFDTRTCPASGPLRFTDMGSPRVDVDFEAHRAVVAQPDDEPWSLTIRL